MSNLNIVEYSEVYNPEVQKVYDSIPFTKFSVVFLKGFSQGINWPSSDTSVRAVINGVKNVVRNTELNGTFLSIFMNIISRKCKNGEKFVFVYDGDDIGENYTHVIIRLMVDEIIGPNSFFIAYRSKTERDQFISSWGQFVKDKKGIKLSLICAPEVRDDKYEATGIYSYRQTASCLDNVQTKYYFYNFGGGPILDKEFSEPLPFTATMTFYNVTRIKGEKTQRNSIFNPNGLDDIPESQFYSPIEIIVNKGEIPFDIMKQNRVKPGDVIPCKTEFELTSDETFKFRGYYNGELFTFRDVYTKLSRNSVRVLKSLARRLEVKGWNSMKKNELVKVCTPLICFKKTKKTKPEKMVTIRKSREKNRIPRNSRRKPRSTQSGETAPCDRSMLLKSDKRKKTYRLRKSVGRPRKPVRKSVGRPRKSVRKSVGRPRK